MKLWVYLVAALAVIGALAGLYYTIDSHGYDRGSAAVQLKWDEANRKQREAEAKQAGTAATKLETANIEAKVVYKTLTRTVDKIVERPIYRNACFDDDGLRSANAALSGALAPAGGSADTVPKPAAAR